MPKNRNRFVPFSKVKPEQIFRHDNTVWSKSKNLIQSGDIEFNSFRIDDFNTENLERCMLHVRFFDGSVLVNIGQNDEFLGVAMRIPNCFENDN